MDTIFFCLYSVFWSILIFVKYWRMAVMFADFVTQKTPFHMVSESLCQKFMPLCQIRLATFSKNSASVNVKVVQEINQWLITWNKSNLCHITYLIWTLLTFISGFVGFMKKLSCTFVLLMHKDMIIAFQIFLFFVEIGLSLWSFLMKSNHGRSKKSHFLQV